MMQDLEFFELIMILLNGLILPMTGWVLYTVSALQRSIAVQMVHGETHATEILDLRTRIAAVETRITEVRIKMAREEYAVKGLKPAFFDEGKKQ